MEAAMNRRKLCFSTVFTIAVAITSTAAAEVLVGVPLGDNPDTSKYNKQIQVSAELAAAELNAKGGVLGEHVRLIFANDECKPEPAAAVAEKFVEQGVTFVDGHLCSGAGLAASKIYERAGILMITGTAASPKLTDEGRANIFRICGRSDQEGQMAASYLAEQWRDKNIAILHDGSTYGQGLAEFTKAYLNRMGKQEALFEQYTAGKDDYTDVVAKLKAAGIDVVYIGGYEQDAGRIILQAKEKGYGPQLVSGKGVGADPAFGNIAGAAADGTLVTASRDTRQAPEAAQVMAAFRGKGIDSPMVDALYSYAVFQVWAQAVEKAGSLDLAKVTEALHSHQFDTAVGRIAFDKEGDVTESGFEWFIWTKNGPVPKR
jgi:branched-chain amino acid transport system substrate-binding protein